MADNRLLAELARKSGGKLLDTAIDALLPLEVDKLPAGKPTLLGKAAGSVALRVAMRSVPGAIVVGGAMLAKRLYDRRHAAKAPEKAEPKA